MQHEVLPLEVRVSNNANILDSLQRAAGECRILKTFANAVK